MGRPIKEGENPVGETARQVSRILSISGHEESGENTGGPPSKPKYYLMTDRGEVLGRNGEKNPGRGVKRT